MFLWLAALFTSFFMGANIGGNNAAAAMGAAYGAGARTKLEAVALISIFSLLGAVLSGGEVIKTLGGGIVHGQIILQTAIIVVAVASFVIFAANILRIPISTSQAAVGAVVGAGLTLGISNLNTPKILEIVAWWTITPLFAWLVTYLIGKYLYHWLVMLMAEMESEEKIRRTINALLTISGGYLAYSAGANNTANAVGPFVHAGLFTPLQGAIFGGMTLGVGSLVLGGRVLDTVGKDIAELCILRAALVEFIAAGIVHLASYQGIPVSLGEIVTASVIGIGCGNSGMQVAKSKVVKKIIMAWFLSPLLAGSLTYATIKILAI